jgi:hypothetical protein
VGGDFAFHQAEKSFTFVAGDAGAPAIPTAELRPAILGVACPG